MTTKAVFEGLVFDENDQPLGTRQVIDAIRYQVEDNKDLIAEQTIKMIGDVDLFTHAIIQNQLENLDDQFDHLLSKGIPEDGRVYLGMLGFKIIVDYHGDVVRIEQPAAPIDGED